MEFDFFSPLIIALLVSLAINLTMFVVAFWLQSDKLTDVSYAATFAAIAIWAFGISGKGWYRWLLLVMVLAWALRLGGFLLYRVIGKGKDARFDEMRGDFVKFGKFWLAQAITVWVMLLPSVLAFAAQPRFTLVSTLGILVWIVGLGCESVADFQKLAFSKNPVNRGRWITSGIWRYSRHPNYFGEVLVWVGVYLYVVSSLPLLQALVGLVSPLFISILLLFVSGIPILERSADKRWGKLDAYQSYKRRTSILVPWLSTK